MSPIGYCQNCRSRQPLGEFREGDQPAFWCQTCGRPVAPPPADGERLSPQPPTVLCIDDDRLLLRLFSDVLERFGFRTVVATDGATGIEVAKRERPTLILLDVVMPGLDGIEVCRRLRAEPELDETRIILLTALEDPELSAQGRAAGATLAIRKPFGPELIVETIQRVLDWRPGQDTL
jgi:CheY-like chemotaxis protein